MSDYRGIPLGRGNPQGGGAGNFSARSKGEGNEMNMRKGRRKGRGGKRSRDERNKEIADAVMLNFVDTMI